MDGECKGFVYGGCGGNPNNFETYDHCFEACKDRIDMTKHDAKYDTRNKWEGKVYYSDQLI